jgi:hypothetical protein
MRPFGGITTALVAVAVVLAGAQFTGWAARPPDQAPDQPLAKSSTQPALPALRPLHRSPPAATRPNATRAKAEAEQHTLAIRLLDRTGRPATSSLDGAYVINLDTGGEAHVQSGESLSLPAGRYAIHAIVDTPRPSTEPEGTVMAHPELRLDRDLSMTLDARRAHPISVRTNQRTARGGVWVVETMSRPEASPYPTSVGWLADPQFHVLSVYTVPGASSNSFAFSNRLSLIEPAVELFAPDQRLGLGRVEIPAYWEDGSPVPHGRSRLRTAYGGQGRAEDLEQIDPTGKLVVLSVPGDLTYQELYERIRAIKTAGGRIVAFDVTSDEESAFTNAADADVEPVLPTLRLWGSTAGRFVDRVRTEAPTVDLTSRSVSRYRYELAFPEHGQVSPDQHHFVRDRELAAVRTRYHETRFYAPSGIALYHMFGTELGNLWLPDTMSAGVRTEYFSPGTWDIKISGQCFQNSIEPDLELRAGRTYQISWGAAVRGPSLAGTQATSDGPRPWAFRQDNRVEVRLPLYTDAAGHPCVPDEDAEEEGLLAGTTSLYRNGMLVGTQPHPARGAFDIPADEAEYRLTTNTRWTADPYWWPLSTTVDATWTFRSANQGSDPAALQLLAVRYAPNVDIYNRAPGRQRFEFPVTVTRQDQTDPPKLRSLRLEVSYDDGGTWKLARLRQTANGWTASITHPDSGFASLRAHATDTNGNTTTQTITRAYAIGKITGPAPEPR